MKLNTFVTAGCTAALLLTSASAAMAQAAAAPAAPPAISHGPAIPGVCIISPDVVIGASTVGKYVQTRLQQIDTQVTSELTSEQTAIQNDAKALDTAKATLDQNTFDQRNAALQLRANAWNRKGQLRQRELQATQQKAVGRIYQEMEPVIRTSYQNAKCSLLLQGEAVVLGNPAMNITPAVITGLNAKITQFTFDRERLDQASPTGQTGK